MIFDDLDLVKFDDVLLVLVCWPATKREKGREDFVFLNLILCVKMRYNRLNTRQAWSIINMGW